MKKSKSSHQWLRDHEDDEYVKRARSEGYRSRACYKLLEINDKYKLIKKGSHIVDLGAAPGGWSQVAVKQLAGSGKVIALDILPMDPIPGVTFLQGDFTEAEPFEALLEALDGQSLDLVISDMAPNLSGMKQIDQPRAAYLVELAVDFCDEALKKDGNFVCKCFEGEGIEELRGQLRKRFKKVINFKPKASRGKSREIYVIGEGHLNQPGRL